jgi:lysozyme
MKLSANGQSFVKAEEGCRLLAYRDQAGVLTIGYGHTGTDVTDNLEWTQGQADNHFIEDIVSREDQLSKLIKVSVNQNQFDALFSLMYNIGYPALKDSTLLRLLNQGSMKKAAEQFTMWNRAGGIFNPGLLARRTRDLM